MIPIGGQEHGFAECRDLPEFLDLQLPCAAFREQAIAPVLPGVAREVADAGGVGKPAEEVQRPAFNRGSPDSLGPAMRRALRG